MKYRTIVSLVQGVSSRGDKGVPKFPHQPLPIMDVPFSRIAMDIVGPLQRTQAGKKYILVVCEYATRYPEALPLPLLDR